MLLQTKKTWTICISTDEVLAYPPDKEIMQTPTPYEQREHQLCFFFIQLNRQVSSVRKKSQCAFYVVICLPAPRANETKVVLFLKKQNRHHLSAYTPLATCAPRGILHGDTRSFRATTRNPGKPTRDYVNKSPACSLWAPHRVRGDTMRIGGGGGTLVIPRYNAESRNTTCSFYSFEFLSLS